MSSRRLVLADLVTGLLLAAVGIGVLMISIDMPRFEERGVNPWTVPGIMPGAIGAVLAILATVLIVRSMRGLSRAEPPKPDQHKTDQTNDNLERPSGTVAVVLASLIGGVYVLLLGKLPFSILTFVFLLAFMLAFESRALRRGTRRWGRLAIIAGTATAVSLIVPYVFETLFLVRLP